MTAPQNPASAPGPAGFDARREAGGRRRAEPMRGSLGDAGPGAQRPAPRLDLRAEFAALANEPHPFAFWQRLEQLPERFEREHRSAPAPVAPSRPSTGGLPSLSGDLGGEAARPPEGMSGSLDSAAVSEAERRPEFTGGLSGSLIPPQPDSTPLAPNPHERAAEEGASSVGPALRGDLPQAEPTREAASANETAPVPDGPAAQQHAQVGSVPTGPPPAPMGPPGGPMPQAEPPEPSNRHNAPEPPRPQSGPPQSPAPHLGPPPAGPPPAGPPPQVEQPPAGPPPAGPPAGPPPQVEQPPTGPPPPGPPPAGPPPAGPPSGPMPQAAPGQQPPQGPPAGRPPGPPVPPPPQGHSPAPPQPPGPPPQQPRQQAPQQQAPQPPQPQPPQPPQQPQQERTPQQSAERGESAQSSRPVARTPKPVERADGGFGPMGSAGTWAAGAGKAGYGRTPVWSPEDFKEERRDVDELRAGSGYKPGETGSGAVPQFLIEADDLFDEEDDGGRLVAPPVLGESPSSFRDF